MIQAKTKVAKKHKESPSELIDKFRKDCAIRGMTPESITRYISTIKIFCKFLDKKKIGLMDTDREILREFVEYLRFERKVSVKTLDNYFTEISSFYEFLVFERLINSNPVIDVRKRYLRRYKSSNGIEQHTHKLISIEDMSRLINSVVDVRDKAIVTLLAKTGIRRRELIALDIEDINWVDQSILLKPTAKRTNRTVFFDAEAAFLLKKWLRIREGRNKKGLNALFLNAEGDRLERTGVSHIIVEAAKRMDLHDSNSNRLEDHFSPHCCRHWFTTHLRRAGMPREFIQELRGDARREAIDIYDHIDLKELKESYLAHIPQLGI
ncbi:MAG: tyrosine-type recombinase/integrase [Methanotrichaceae archaeon]|nr:tyrosine-type recombinase/integrase [Methanotrichaceae archaeon]